MESTKVERNEERVVREWYCSQVQVLKASSLLFVSVVSCFDFVVVLCSTVITNKRYFLFN